MNFYKSRPPYHAPPSTHQLDDHGRYYGTSIRPQLSHPGGRPNFYAERQQQEYRSSRSPELFTARYRHYGGGAHYQQQTYTQNIDLVTHTSQAQQQHLSDLRNNLRRPRYSPTHHHDIGDDVDMLELDHERDHNRHHIYDHERQRPEDPDPPQSEPPSREGQSRSMYVCADDSTFHDEDLRFNRRYQTKKQLHHDTNEASAGLEGLDEVPLLQVRADDKARWVVAPESAGSSTSADRKHHDYDMRGHRATSVVEPDIRKEAADVAAVIVTSAEANSNSSSAKMLEVPTFDPGESAMSAHQWLQVIDAAGMQGEWSDDQRKYAFVARVEGAAAQWHRSNIQRLADSWADVKRAFVAAFPSDMDYCRLLTEMMARRRRRDETLSSYFLHKVTLLNACEIRDRRAVSCVVGGLSERVQDELRQRNFDCIEDLFEYVSRVDALEAAKRAEQQKSTSDDDPKHAKKSELSSSQSKTKSTSSSAESKAKGKEEDIKHATVASSSSVSKKSDSTRKPSNSTSGSAIKVSKESSSKNNNVASKSSRSSTAASSADNKSGASRKDALSSRKDTSSSRKDTSSSRKDASSSSKVATSSSKDVTSSSKEARSSRDIQSSKTHHKDPPPSSTTVAAPHPKMDVKQYLDVTVNGVLLCGYNDADSDSVTIRDSEARDIDIVYRSARGARLRGFGRADLTPLGQALVLMRVDRVMMTLSAFIVADEAQPTSVVIGRSLREHPEVVFRVQTDGSPSFQHAAGGGGGGGRRTRSRSRSRSRDRRRPDSGVGDVGRASNSFEANERLMASFNSSGTRRDDKRR